MANGKFLKTCGGSSSSIGTIESLREHLQWAIELEHFTMPPYLCALYSLDSRRNPEATEVIVSILVEEMLHMTLAGNLLNAVGGRPQLDTPRMLASYPRCLPHGDRSFEVSLVCFCADALDTFLRVERPAQSDASPESDCYATIGQFYDAIGRGLGDLCESLGEANVFCGAPSRQVTAPLFSNTGGRIIEVNSLATAHAALAEIVEQGEGAARSQVWDGDCDVFHPGREQVAHYYRLQQLKLGRRYRRGDTPDSGPTGDAILIDWDGVRPMQSNPRPGDHAPHSAIRKGQEQFNQSYCGILRLLDQAFDGRPHLLPAAIGRMYALRTQAQALMEIPIEDGPARAGPTFEYVAPTERSQAGEGFDHSRALPDMAARRANV